MRAPAARGVARFGPDEAPVYDLRRARVLLPSSSESRGKPPSDARRCRSDIRAALT